jgi:uncharacterized membrane protein YbhN (UPF0104 family)
MKSSLQQRLEEFPRSIFQSVVRAGAGTSSASSLIDFSVLSVAVTTLALILLVQFLRQQLDNKAVGRPFFKSVLKGVYAECKLKEEFIVSYLLDNE